MFTIVYRNSGKQQKKFDISMEKKDMKSPKLSIIIPVYNVESYIKHCLDSIKAQTMNDFEIIIVNEEQQIILKQS